METILQANGFHIIMEQDGIIKNQYTHMTIGNGAAGQVGAIQKYPAMIIKQEKYIVTEINLIAMMDMIRRGIVSLKKKLNKHIQCQATFWD